MTWIATPNSSTIAGFEYFSDTQTLVIEFIKSGRYKYFDVPQGVYEQLKTAPSTGQFHAQNIKNIYRYAKA